VNLLGMILEVVHIVVVDSEVVPGDTAARSLEELAVVLVVVDILVDKIDRAAVDKVDKSAAFVCTSDSFLALAQPGEYARQNNR
jgi:hypothetical protein